MEPALRLNVMFAHFPYAGNGACSAESPNIRDWEVDTALKMHADKRIGEFHRKNISDTPICMTRNAAVLEARKRGCHLLLMVDSDQHPDLHAGESWYKPFWDEAFNFIYDRYQKGPHVVFAPYCGPPNGTENVYVFKTQSYGNHFQETTWKLDPYGRDEASMMTGIQEAAAGPTGMVLFDMRAFELIEPVAITKRQVLEAVRDGVMTIEQGEYAMRDGFFYYEWENQYAAQKASTEDVTVTRDIALAGQAKLGYNPVYCAWDSWIGHHKPWTVGKPKRYMIEHVNSSYRKAVLDGAHVNERIVEMSSVNEGNDPLSRRLREMAISSESAFAQRQNGNGKHNGNGRHPVIAKHQWSALPEAIQLAAAAAKGKKLVVDIGPGATPFSLATECVGRKSPGKTYSQRFHELDLDTDRLPYADQSVDFVFCRHVLEDVANPSHLLSEIRRVAKAGYIETPSPLAEATRGVDQTEHGADGLGYCHHRSIIWSCDGTLSVLPKLPIWDRLKLPDGTDALNGDKMLWNNYHLWSGDLQYRVLSHEIDFKVGVDSRYKTFAELAIDESWKTTERLFIPPGTSNPFNGKDNGHYRNIPWHEHGKMPKEHIAALVSEASEICDRQPTRKARFLEVGTWLGGTAIELSNFGSVHCVDTWEGSPSDETSLCVKDAGGPDAVYAEFVKRVGDRLDKTIYPHRKDSQRAAAMHWAQFDLILIDADHSYEAVKADILAWWKHLRHDGVMIGHDYKVGAFPGVKRAVQELFGDAVEEIGMCDKGGLWKVRKADFPDFQCEVTCGTATKDY